MASDDTQNKSTTLGQETKIGKLARIERNTRIKVNETEKRSLDNAKKITILKNILGYKKEEKVGDKLPKSTKEQTAKEYASINKNIVAINRNLIAIADLITKGAQAEQKADDAAAKRARKKADDEKKSGQESLLESGLKKSLIKPLESMKKKAAGPFDRLFKAMEALFMGFLSIKGLDALEAWMKGDNEELEKIKGDVLKGLALAGGIALALNGGIGLVMGAISGLLVGLLGKIPALIGLLASPLLLKGLLVAGLVVAGTWALGKVVEWGIDKVRLSKYGQGNVKKGIFATRLGDNYGRILSQSRRDEMTPEEKKDAKLIKIYDELLQARQKTNSDLYRIKNQTTGFGEEFERNRADKIAELEAQLAAQDKQLAQMERGEGGFLIQGKTINQLFNLYQQTGKLPATTLTQKYYPNTQVFTPEQFEQIPEPNYESGRPQMPESSTTKNFNLQTTSIDFSNMKMDNRLTQLAFSGKLDMGDLGFEVPDIQVIPFPTGDQENDPVGTDPSSTDFPVIPTKNLFNTHLDFSYTLFEGQ
tara:strand:- start:4986 stop:6587 length:1602 start_codon:yes stop_codon:yes gene_type:complete